jgi:polyribonucleotide nucleotidyltransferase
VSIEVGKMARQADGAVLVRQGDYGRPGDRDGRPERREGVISCPYRGLPREHLCGRQIPVASSRRRGRPNEKETLTSRMIDRPIRPLFPKGWRCETQVVALVLSAICETIRTPGGHRSFRGAERFGYSLRGPHRGGARGLQDQTFLVNPTTSQLETSRLDLVVVGTETEVVMVEAGANEVSEQEMVDAILFGQSHIVKLVQLQKELRSELGTTKRTFAPAGIPSATFAEVESKISEPLCRP